MKNIIMLDYTYIESKIKYEIRINKNLILSLYLPRLY